MIVNAVRYTDYIRIGDLFLARRIDDFADTAFTILEHFDDLRVQAESKDLCSGEFPGGRILREADVTEC
jgi:hypothetical protein